MGRLGKKPIILPEKVKAKIEGQKVLVTGPLGNSEFIVPDGFKAGFQEKNLIIEATDNNLAGRRSLIRKLLSNVVLGVNEGFTKSLQVVGVGYRAEVVQNKLVLYIGFSHPVEFPIPKGIKITVDKKTTIHIHGVYRDEVGQVAATIRDLKHPEPYKGTGIKYTDERIIRKAGKAAVGAATGGLGGKK